MKEIHLTNGGVALVDDEDYERINIHAWRQHDGYAVRKENNRLICMHREIINTPAEKDTDHINHDRLDNQKANLRACTSIQNSYNQTRRKNNKSGYMGVSKDHRRWRAQIRFSGKVLYLGAYKTPTEAAKVYDTRAIELRGEYASTNFPVINNQDECHLK